MSALSLSCKSGVVEDDEYAVSPIPQLYHEDIDCFFAEQSKVQSDVKLSYMLRRIDDTFSTEDRWPI